MFTKYVSNLEKYIDEPTDKLNDFLGAKDSDNDGLSEEEMIMVVQLFIKELLKH